MLFGVLPPVILIVDRPSSVLAVQQQNSDILSCDDTNSIIIHLNNQLSTPGVSHLSAQSPPPKTDEFIGPTVSH